MRDALLFPAFNTGNTSAIRKPCLSRHRVRGSWQEAFLLPFVDPDLIFCSNRLCTSQRLTEKLHRNDMKKIKWHENKFAVP